MSGGVVLRIDGEVDRPLEVSFVDLKGMDERYQIRNVSRFGVKRDGDAVSLLGLLAQAGVRESASYLGLHARRDNFHASIPLEPIREKAFLIYSSEGRPLDESAGGPLRFFVPDHAACQAEEIDECANVKFVEHLELTCGRGFDNRPQDEEEHARLHEGG